MLGPPILLPTPGTTTTTSTTSRPTTAFTPWTWWTPADDILTEDDNQKKFEELKTTIESETEQNIELTSVTIDTEIITLKNELTYDAFISKVPETSTSITHDITSTVQTTAADELENNNENTVTEKENNNKSMKEKYLKLVEHNSQLVEILRNTMEVQADLFKRILKYMFP